jgi:hypothetical protein
MPTVALSVSKNTLVSPQAYRDEAVTRRPRASSVRVQFGWVQMEIALRKVGKRGRGPECLYTAG